MRMGTSYGFSAVIRAYMSKRLPYFSSTAFLPMRLIASAKSRYTPWPPGPTPLPSSHTFFAAREAMSRGTRLPKDG